ncbi:hypothetical protein [Micrococcus luteus]|uniref:hypothetical protein n=1 Tax=Micrococcus luteus TaxID=1270 RepID=UPI0033242DE1
MAERISGIYEENLRQMIGRFALTGRDDPTIAARLGITVGQVRRIRKKYNIAPGEQRWLPADRPAKAVTSDG